MQNAIDFNTELHSYGIMAKMMQDIFEKRIAGIKVAPAPKEGRAPPGPNKRDLFAVVNTLGPMAAAEMMEKIEELYSHAVMRKGGGESEERVAVNIDSLGEDACAELLEKALELAKATPPPRYQVSNPLTAPGPLTR